MKFDIRYRMHFDYGVQVSESQNEIRVRPRDDEHQQVNEYRLSSEPPSRVLSTVDYWGNNVDHLGVRVLHDQLELVAEASVDTSSREPVAVDPLLAELGDPSFRTSHWEFLQSSPHVEWDDDLVARTRTAIEGQVSARGAIEAIVAYVGGLLDYRSGTTSIGVSLPELVAGGTGVCQDFAHLAIGAMRSVGIPARYVSGYLFATDETTLSDDDASTVSVQTHAWVDAALPGHGWWGQDPTNGTEVGERHVVIGYGRDYTDVPPVRGVFNGDAEAVVDAEVVIAKLAPAIEAHRAHPDMSLRVPFPARPWHQQQQQ